MYVIERAICMADKDAQERGIRLTDSNIKSALNQARSIGPEKVIASGGELETREDIVKELALSIAANREFIMEESEGPSGTAQTEVSRADWVKAISAVKASLKVHKSPEPGSRYYLDYVRRFIEERRV